MKACTETLQLSKFIIIFISFHVLNLTTMNLNIQGRHLAITPALNSYVKKKLQKIKYYFDHILHAHIVLQTDKNNFIAEGTLTVEQHYFHNKVTTEDMYKSIDLLFDKLERQVRRYKEALRDSRRRLNARNDEKHQSHTRELELLQKSSKIFIDKLPSSPKPMSVLEAVLQLRIDKSVPLKGFFSLEHNEHLTFLLREERAEHFALIAYEYFWEFSALELLQDEQGKQLLVTHHVEPIKPSLESIEDAVDFLLHNDSRYRFFTSLRTEHEMLLYEQNKRHFSLLHH